MDYMPENSHKMMKEYVSRKDFVPILSVKLYGYQLFRSIAYIHVLGICHLDIKPQNLMFYPNTNQSRLCDFGIS